MTKSSKQKIQQYKTIGLISQTLLATNAFTALTLSLKPNWWFLSLLGIGITTQSAYILIHRHIIMEEYEHEVEGEKKISVWRKPSKLIYDINIMIIWPLMLIAGAIMFVIGILEV